MKATLPQQNGWVLIAYLYNTSMFAKKVTYAYGLKKNSLLLSVFTPCHQILPPLGSSLLEGKFLCPALELVPTDLAGQSEQSTPPSVLD